MPHLFILPPPSRSPVIQLHSQEEVPLTASALAAKTAASSAAGLSVLDPAVLPRSESPTHSGGSSDTERSVPSSTSSLGGSGGRSPGSLPALGFIKLDGAGKATPWHSPNSSMANIYAAPSVAAVTATAVGSPRRAAAAAQQRKGWNFSLFGTSGYQPDHSD